MPTAKAVGILVLTLVWIQMGLREIWENQAFVDGHCYRPHNNRFIGGYCAFHTAAADYTSVKNLVHTFCLAGIWPMVITAMLIVSFNQMLISMGVDVVVNATKWDEPEELSKKPDPPIVGGPAWSINSIINTGADNPLPEE
jgi:hypothetical protein